MGIRLPRIIPSNADPCFEASSWRSVGGKTANIVTVFGRRTFSAGIGTAGEQYDLVPYLTGTTTKSITALTGSETLTLVSTNALDASGMTGAQTVAVTYLDNAGNTQTATHTQ